MKVSYNWLKEHLPLELSATELAGHLLKIGFEVAGHERLARAGLGRVRPEDELRRHEGALERGRDEARIHPGKSARPQNNPHDLRPKHQK